MIEAILKNKIRDIHCTDAFDREDSLTASFFGLLFYLDSELVEKYFYSLLDTETGKVQEVEFWPHWDAENTSNEKYVEPDVFVRFENLDLIIEVKKEGNKLFLKQAENQINAYENEYCNEETQEKHLFYLGFIRDKYEQEEEFSKLKDSKKYVKAIKLITWYDMLSTLETVTPYKLNQRKILNDIEELLLLHSIFKPKFDWEKFGENKNLSDTNFANSLKIIRQWKK